MQKIQLQGTIPEELSGLRVDQAIARIFPDFSRARLQLWIKSGEILLDNRARKPKERVTGGEAVSINVTLDDLNPVSEPQAIDLDIVFEDDSLLVLNKPAGLVVHPGAGNADGTLLNALLHHCAGLSAVPRAGIIHRLDKNTTGLMVVAKTLAAHHFLVDAMQERAIKREYEAIIHGVMTAGGTIDAPIGRHPVDRKRMAVVEGGKSAVTHYRVQRRFRLHTHVRVQLETGRTHQIRVHMAHRRYPIVGDPVYGGRMRLPKGATHELQEALRCFPRQALHAIQLAVPHPETGQMTQWSTDLPGDMQTLISVLSTDLENAGV
ncbi:MAG TPA: 23S rRNA pseudouridine(1911/1915/1917) synthase RluD [Gammaproteobacteria bacterium]|nr:23S rRNA pseudouridine(1911/1915/1917) synthase RluD [Gammaproteobacteria bacterium]